MDLGLFILALSPGAQCPLSTEMETLHHRQPNWPDSLTTSPHGQNCPSSPLTVFFRDVAYVVD